MSRSLWMNLARAIFFLPDARVIGGGVVLAGLGAGVAVRVVAEFCEHPGAAYHAQPRLGEDDLSGRVLPKMCLDLPLQGRDLGVEQDRKSVV